MLGAGTTMGSLTDLSRAMRTLGNQGVWAQRTARDGRKIVRALDHFEGRLDKLLRVAKGNPWKRAAVNTAMCGIQCAKETLFVSVTEEMIRSHQSGKSGSMRFPSKDLRVMRKLGCTASRSGRIPYSQVRGVYHVRSAAAFLHLSWRFVQEAFPRVKFLMGVLLLTGITYALWRSAHNHGSAEYVSGQIS